MREILFRGKTLISGRWIDGDLRQWSSGNVGICDRATNWTYKVDPDTVGQYTGQKDRNGKPIFEGDLVERVRKVGNELARMYVVWHRGSWQLWDFDDNDDFLWNWCSPAIYYGEDVGGCIVIGNIHDNPELMEVHDATD